MRETDHFSVFSDLEGWNAALQSVCGPYETRPAARGAFGGRIRVDRLNRTEIADIRVRAQRIVKHRHALDQSPSDNLFLIVQRRGHAAMYQEGQEAKLRPGDFTLIDSRYPSEFRYDGRVDQISYHLRWAEIADILPGSSIPRALRFPGDAGYGAVISRYLRDIHSQAPVLDDDNGQSAVDCLSQMLRQLLAGQTYARPWNLARSTERLIRLQRFIDRHLGDPKLSVAMIMEMENISRRTLYRLFSGIGTSPTAWIWERRLSVAHEMLRYFEEKQMRVTDVAYHCGFSDSAHFNHRFKARFGMSPSALRRTGSLERSDDGLFPSHKESSVRSSGR